ncbi:hypothetical protein L195_g008534 [Trifolium pratense]|uniref:Uncharacterized protein n=1 Tax=Trifolium pratense TaxID=57577 RepID=A0A2K3KZ23_TRIPR|nr:hypothetical protein L195_g027416 [Trifolium pratense]PNY11914.1 hypothetical protein L195_g008534 [Trifolium pratense]
MASTLSFGGDSLFGERFLLGDTLLLGGLLEESYFLLQKKLRQVQEPVGYQKNDAPGAEGQKKLRQVQEPAGYQKNDASDAEGATPGAGKNLILHHGQGRKSNSGHLLN